MHTHAVPLGLINIISSSSTPHTRTLSTTLALALCDGFGTLALLRLMLLVLAECARAHVLYKTVASLCVCAARCACRNAAALAALPVNVLYTTLHSHSSASAHIHIGFCELSNGAGHNTHNQQQPCCLKPRSRSSKKAFTSSSSHAARSRVYRHKCTHTYQTVCGGGVLMLRGRACECRRRGRQRMQMDARRNGATQKTRVNGCQQLRRCARIYVREHNVQSIHARERAKKQTHCTFPS